MECVMREIHVVGAAISDGNKILAAQRSEKMKSPLKWEFVGGKVEKNETHRQALQREVYEELGVNIKVNGHIATGTSEADGDKIILHVYGAELVDGCLKPSEHAQVKWVDINNLMELDWAEADIPACEKLINTNLDLHKNDNRT